MPTKKRQQYIEIKSGSVYAPAAKIISKKGTVASVIAGGTISKNAKLIFDRAGITYAEHVEAERPEKERRR